MPVEWYPLLKEYCDQIGITFCSSPFDESMVDVLESVNVPFYKVASYEITHYPLLAKIAKTGKPVILSTGNSGLGDIERAIDNLEKGAAFLEENGKKEGVITTETGLQYEVITKGDGPMPADTSRVKVNYEGTLIDGEVFESSFDRGEPISFVLNGVMPGWTEGLQLMPVGSTYKFYVPSNLGYGPRTSGPIPGNSVLIFKVELLEIEE